MLLGVMPDGWFWMMVAFICVGILSTAYLRARRALLQQDLSLASPLPPSLGIEGVENFLRERDEREAPVKALARSSVTWAGGRKNERADLALVFLHGWSASPLEIDPVDLHVAQRLGANLLRLRLTDHGLAPLERAGAALCDHAKRPMLQWDAATAFSRAGRA